MDDKYFVPDVEDIRVGYECEVQDVIESIFFDGIITTKYSESWKPLIITKQYFTYYLELIATGHLRTLYLTKEQIEAEEWKADTYGPSADGPSFIKNEFYCQMLLPNSTYELNSGLTFSPNLVIRTRSYIVFLGECKSINEFRYICKLLKI